MTRWMVVAVVCAGCSGDFHDGVGPRVPIPNVEGIVVRQGAAALSVRVEVRDMTTHLVLASDHTDAGGAYRLGNVPAGRWEVKVSGKQPGDFDSETRVFELPDSVRTIRLQTFDISAQGATLLEPTADAHLPVPNLAEPLHFHWDPPSAPILSARVQLYDSLGADAWISVQTDQNEILWNGIGNQASYQNQPLPRGHYDWRVKFLYPDSTEARTMTYRLTLE